VTVLVIGKRWSAEDLRTLKAHWGVLTIAKLASKLNRKPSAVSDRARRLGLGSPNADRDFLSLLQIEKSTGYDRIRILNAAAHLHIKVRRLPRNQSRLLNSQKKMRRYALTHPQLDRILTFLREWPDGKRLHHPDYRRKKTT